MTLARHRSRTWVAAVIAALIACIAFLGGRWHMRSQIRNDVSLFAEALSNSMSENGVADEKTIDFKTKRRELEAEAQRMLAGTQVEIGQICDRDWYTVELSSLRITVPKLVSYSGMTDYDEESLVVNFTVHNRDERRVLSLRPDMRITDDVGNDVDQKYPGLTEKFENQYDYIDIKPGETKIISHAFDKPLPKTKAIHIRLQLDSTFMGKKHAPITYTAEIRHVQDFD